MVYPCKMLTTCCASSYPRSNQHTS